MSLQEMHNKASGIRFDLSRIKPSKTLDIGLNGNTVSADPLGRILQLSTFHPEHGIVVASPYEQFDGSKFHQPLYVRGYRDRILKSIRSSEPGFGLRLEDHVHEVFINLENSSRAYFQYTIQEEIHVSTTLHIREDGEVVQSTYISSTAASVKYVRYTLDLGLSVNRASYGQLTEGGPIPIPESENNLKVLGDGRGYIITNPHLGAQVQGCLEIDGRLVQLEKDVQDGSFKGKPVMASTAKMLEIPSNTSRLLTARFRLRPNMTPGGKFQFLPLQIAFPRRQLWKYPANEATFIVRRNLEYILGNCAIPVFHENVALITDHVALPLGWNRDNYWQIRFLLDVHENIDSLAIPEVAREYQDAIKKTAKGHLNWVFRLAQRPHKFWHRSYLVTGRPKDGPIFQLDQQCYPLLEICDFIDTFPDERVFVRGLLEEDTIAVVIRLIAEKKDPHTGLYATDETPGDDAVEYPFHFSSHVLLWHTISRLAKLMTDLGETSELKIARLEGLAQDIRISVLSHFLSVRAETNQATFAYLVDGNGQRTFYHDANDIPTLFATEWGFLASAPELDAWRNTMDFALSPSNEGGYHGVGAFGGLGSVHTRGPWPLGYFQEFVYARMTGNSSAENDAWRRICASKMWDGLFSEAVDSSTAECTSKAWFSWPGAMIGSALLRSEVKMQCVEEQQGL